MVNVRGGAFVVNRVDQARNQADLQVNATQQYSAKVGGHRPAIKLCPDRKSGTGSIFQFRYEPEAGLNQMTLLYGLTGYKDSLRVYVQSRKPTVACDFELD